MDDLVGWMWWCKGLTNVIQFVPIIPKLSMMMAVKRVQLVCGLCAAQGVCTSRHRCRPLDLAKNDVRKQTVILVGQAIVQSFEYGSNVSTTYHVCDKETENPTL